MDKWLPVRKVAVGLIAAVLFWVAQRLGLDLGPDAVNEAAQAIIGFVVAYLVPVAEKVPAVEEAVVEVEKVLDVAEELFGPQA